MVSSLVVNNQEVKDLMTRIIIRQERLNPVLYQLADNQD